MKERAQHGPKQLSFIGDIVVTGEVRQFKIRVHRTREGSPGLTPGSRQKVLGNLPLPQDSENTPYRPSCFDHNIPMTWIPIEGGRGLWVCQQCPGD